MMVRNRRLRTFGLWVLCFLFSLSVFGQEDLRDFDRVHLKDGSIVEGQIIEEGGGTVVVRRRDNITVDIPRSDIAKIDRQETPRGVYERRAEKLPGDTVDPHLKLTRFCLSYDLLIEAERTVRKAVAIEPSRPELYELCAEIFRRQYEKVADDLHETLFDRELSIYQAGLDAGVRTPTLLHRVGWLDRQLGLVDRAVERLTAARKLAETPESKLPILQELGETLLLAGRGSEALEVFEARIAIDAEDAAGRIGAGKAALLTGQLPLARSHFEAVADGSSEAAPRARFGLGVIHYLAGRLEEAEEAFRAAAGETPTARTTYYIGLVRLREGRFLSAATAFDEALNLDPQFYAAHLGLGAIQWFKGRHSAAIDQFDQAASLSGGAPEVPFLKARVYREMEDLDRAQSALREAARKGFELDQVLVALGEVSDTRNQMEDALRLHEYVAARRPDDPGLQYEVGRYRCLLRDLDGAAEAFEAALKSDPSFVPALCGRGYVHYRRAEYDEARFRFERVLELDPENGYAKLVLRRLQESRTRLVWRDPFSRPDSDAVRNYWIEHERYGIDIDLRNGGVLFSGRQKNQGDRETRLHRELERSDFVEFRVQMDVTGQKEGTVGIRVENRSGKKGVFLDVFRTPDGKLWVDRGNIGRETVPEAIGRWEGGTKELKIVLLDRKGIAIELDGRRLTTVELRKLRHRGKVVCTIFGKAPLDEYWELRVDEASIFVERPPEKR